MQKRYTMGQVRQRLARALDDAERGESITIVRRNVTFELRRRMPASRVSERRVLFEVLDPTIESGDWHWSAPGPTMKLRTRKSRR